MPDKKIKITVMKVFNELKENMDRQWNTRSVYFILLLLFVLPEVFNYRLDQAEEKRKLKKKDHF